MSAPRGCSSRQLPVTMIRRDTRAKQRRKSRVQGRPRSSHSPALAGEEAGTGHDADRAAFEMCQLQAALAHKALDSGSLPASAVSRPLKVSSASVALRDLEATRDPANHLDGLAPSPGQSGAELLPKLLLVDVVPRAPRGARKGTPCVRGWMLQKKIASKTLASTRVEAHLLRDPQAAKPVLGGKPPKLGVRVAAQLDQSFARSQSLGRSSYLSSHRERNRSGRDHGWE